MALKWSAEPAARWDADKQRILGASPDGVFRFGELADGALVPGDWWRVEDDAGQVVAYGWMDVTWGWAPMLLAVDPTTRGQGVGSFVVEQLAAEASRKGLHYVFNVIPDAHPDPEALAAWLGRRGFEPAQTDARTLRRQVL